MKDLDWYEYYVKYVDDLALTLFPPKTSVVYNSSRYVIDSLAGYCNFLFIVGDNGTYDVSIANLLVENTPFRCPSIFTRRSKVVFNPASKHQRIENVRSVFNIPEFGNFCVLNFNLDSFYFEEDLTDVNTVFDPVSGLVLDTYDLRTYKYPRTLLNFTRA